LDSNDLLAYQPDYYKSSKVMGQINTTNASELTILNGRVDKEYNNLYPDTADSDTLSRFERDNGLKVMPNYDIEYRRTRIYSRVIGEGDFSVDMVKAMARAYTNGEVDIILDIPNFMINIKFISVYGYPPNISDFQEAIEEVKPAYFAVEYKFKYATWNNIKEYTWGELANYTWDDVLNGKMQAKDENLYIQANDGNYYPIIFE
jgi:hypothetical protein